MGGSEPVMHDAARDATSAQAPRYASGFGNEFASEALPGALPVGRNSPRRCAYGLYAEQLSGSAFTAPRGANRRSWLYRIRPGATHGAFRRIDDRAVVSTFADIETPPSPLRWDPLPLPEPGVPVDFVQGLFTMAGHGDPASMSGCAIHVYCANAPMRDRFFYDADAELLIVPQLGRLRLRTEFGVLDVEPQEIASIPRGVRFAVELPELKSAGGTLEAARGYVCENFGAPFRLPDLGPIGSRTATR